MANFGWWGQVNRRPLGGLPLWISVWNFGHVIYTLDSAFAANFIMIWSFADFISNLMWNYLEVDCCLSGETWAVSRPSTLNFRMKFWSRNLDPQLYFWRKFHNNWMIYWFYNEFNSKILWTFSPVVGAEYAVSRPTTLNFGLKFWPRNLHTRLYFRWKFHDDPIICWFYIELNVKITWSRLPFIGWNTGRLEAFRFEYPNETPTTRFSTVHLPWAPNLVHVRPSVDFIPNFEMKWNQKVFVINQWCVCNCLLVILYNE